MKPPVVIESMGGGGSGGAGGDKGPFHRRIRRAFRIAWAWLAWRVDAARGWLEVLRYRLGLLDFPRFRGRQLREFGKYAMGFVPTRTETPGAFRERLTRSYE